MRSLDWMAEANCTPQRTGLDFQELDKIFFPERGDTRKVVQRAKNICNRCNVKQECLEYALFFSSYNFIGRDRRMEGVVTDQGIWGGTTWKERREIREKKRGK